MTRLHFVIHGRVQGVGYRWYVQRCAEDLALGGWVRNHWNGTVEVEAEGADKALADFEERLKTGAENPARVERIEKRPLAPTGRGEAGGFDISF